MGVVSVLKRALTRSAPVLQTLVCTIMLLHQSPSEDYKSSVLPREEKLPEWLQPAALKITAVHLNPQFRFLHQASGLKYKFWEGGALSSVSPQTERKQILPLCDTVSKNGGFSL